MNYSVVSHIKQKQTKTKKHKQILIYQQFCIPPASFSVFLFYFKMEIVSPCSPPPTPHPPPLLFYVRAFFLFSLFFFFFFFLFSSFFLFFLRLYDCFSVSRQVKNCKNTMLCKAKRPGVGEKLRSTSTASLCRWTPK